MYFGYYTGLPIKCSYFESLELLKVKKKSQSTMIWQLHHTNGLDQKLCGLIELIGNKTWKEDIHDKGWHCYYNSGQSYETLSKTYTYNILWFKIWGITMNLFCLFLKDIFNFIRQGCNDLMKNYSIGQQYKMYNVTNDYFYSNKCCSSNIMLLKRFLHLQ